ncbi:DUF4351 domain-containing protein [Thiorhodococcus mannitoliphagus]|uniref:DUF4351 domain-containing protein n=1 Tax=Thiorhodococcus mannitoliphagus TaxID=329406 RepID=A0A6P1E192_9GAMM|nr:DUF4351 domain-containing protein [Thiorhodococcus mannitoliphagus]NEX23669.1 DUF4351 domain-containing protein [Thiorhodococcus mannitoliphagus]
MTANSQTADPTAQSDYDSPWKEALERYFPEFLGLLFPAIHAEIDWTAPYRSLDNELQQITGDADSGRRYADKLLDVRTRDGRETWVLVHVEVQSDAHAVFPKRMFRYNYRIRDRYDRSVVSLAVLSDSNQRFRPVRYEDGRWGCRIAFEFPMVKLLDYAEPDRWAALEASDNVFALVVMAQIRAKVTDDAETLKGWKFRLIRLMYERGYERALILELFRLIDWMIRLPAGLEADFRQELYAYEEQQRMPYVTTVEQAGIQRGEAIILLRQLSKKFGAEVVEHYRTRIESADPEQLEAWCERILSAESPETIFH